MLNFVNLLLLLPSAAAAGRLCSCCLEPVVDKGVIIDGLCYQAHVPNVTTIYNQGRNKDVEDYLQSHIYYIGPRYIRLGFNWVYDSTTKNVSIAVEDKKDESTDITILSVYHTYTEDYSKDPKHFIHQGIKTDLCCSHWEKTNWWL